MKKSLGAKALLHPTPVLVIGSYGKNNLPNIMTAAWGGICCSKPPCVNVSLRKATFSYGCILEHKAFTVNIPSQDQVHIADYAGMASGRTEDKFKTLGLTAVRSDRVDAPYVAEFSLVLECKLIHTHEIGLHTLFIGEILDVKADPAVLFADGNPDLEKIRPVLYAPGNQEYYAAGKSLGGAFEIGKTVT